jgi:hypothetical protein
MSAIVLSRRSALLGTTSIVAVGLTSCVPFPTSPQTILSDVRTIMNAANLVWGAVLKVYPKLVSAGAAGIIGQAYSAVSDIIALGQLIWPASNPAPGTPPLDTTQKFVKAVNTFLDLLSQITGILATVVPSPTFTAIAAGLSLALKLATAIETALGVAPPPAPCRRAGTAAAWRRACRARPPDVTDNRGDLRSPAQRGFRQAGRAQHSRNPVAAAVGFLAL